VSSIDASRPRYAELQVTSHFSFLRGASSCEELFAQAAYLGIEALAITDLNSLAGIIRAYEDYKGRNEQLSLSLEVKSGNGYVPSISSDSRGYINAAREASLAEAPLSEAPVLPERVSE
jgi:error-prone DNA polymerase